MPNFDGKSETNGKVEDLFQTILKNCNQLTKEVKLTDFHNFTGGDASQTIRNISSPNEEILDVFLTVFSRKNLEPLSMAAAKRKLKQIVFNRASQKRFDFLNELQKLANDAFGGAALANFEQFIYDQMPPRRKKP